jgi:hypothetical protein
VFVNHLCEAKGELDGEADEAQESFCELVVASGDAPIALDSLEEVFYPMTTPVDRCGEGDSHRAVTATRNAGVIPLVAAVCLRVELIIGFVANEGRIFW